MSDLPIQLLKAVFSRFLFDLVPISAEPQDVRLETQHLQIGFLPGDPQVETLFGTEGRPDPEPGRRWNLKGGRRLAGRIRPSGGG